MLETKGLWATTKKKLTVSYDNKKTNISKTSFTLNKAGYKMASSAKTVSKTAKQGVKVSKQQSDTRQQQVSKSSLTPSKKIRYATASK